MLPSTGATTDFAAAPRAAGHDPTSKRSRLQTALVSLGHRNLTNLRADKVEEEFTALVAKTLEATLCALVEVLPEQKPPTIDRIVCVPDLAARSGPQVGAAQSGDSLLGTVLQKSARLLVADVQTDGRFRNSWFYRQGVRSAVAIPLSLNDQPLGALVVGHAGAGYYDDEDLLFLELIGSLLVAHVARARAEDAVRKERAYASALLDGNSALAVVLSPEGVVTRTNRACQLATGLRNEQLLGRCFWNSLCIPTEARLVEGTFAQLNSEVTAIEFESTLMAPDGERRFMNWRLTQLIDSPRSQAVVVATGVDITGQRHAEQQARQAVVAAEAARRLVEELRSVIPPGSSPSPATGSAASESPSSRPAPCGAERRTSDRKLFPYRQLVAPYISGIVPARDKFESVRCWDISAGGISFLLDVRPTFQTLVVVLGGPNGETLMSADIVRVTELDEDDAKGFLLGCRFTGKL